MTLAEILSDENTDAAAVLSVLRWLERKQKQIPKNSTEYR